jgi:type IV pilus modification protein PilV
MCRCTVRRCGFTLIELLVVMVILAGCLLGLMTVQVSALRSVTVAKERQQATALTNRTMEQLRALPTTRSPAGSTPATSPATPTSRPDD